MPLVTHPIPTVFFLLTSFLQSTEGPSAPRLLAPPPPLPGRAHDPRPSRDPAASRPGTDRWRRSPSPPPYRPSPTTASSSARPSKDLKADPKDEFLKTLRAIIRCFSCPERYFEKVIRLAIAGMGTDENTLTRIITTRAEMDLKLIKEAYQKRNSVPLERAVAGDTSGDYERILLALLGQE